MKALMADARRDQMAKSGGYPPLNHELANYWLSMYLAASNVRIQSG